MKNLDISLNLPAIYYHCLWFELISKVVHLHNLNLPANHHYCLNLGLISSAVNLYNPRLNTQTGLPYIFCSQRKLILEPVWFPERPELIPVLA